MTHHEAMRRHKWVCDARGLCNFFEEKEKTPCLKTGGTTIGPGGSGEKS